MKNGKTHSLLLLLVAGYMGYVSYHLWENYRAGTENISAGVYIALILFFLLAAAGILFYAFRIWQKARRTETEKERDESSGKDA